MTAAFTAGSVLTATNLNNAVNTNTINAQTAAGYSLVLTDGGKLVTLSNASAQNLTIPLNSSVAFPTGTVIEALNIGAGAWTVTATGGVTLAGATVISTNSRARLVKTGTDTWYSVILGPPSSARDFVSTNQTTTSTSYTDLATVGPAVTVTTGTKALVLFSSGGYNATTGAVLSASVAVSGATTLAASDDWALSRKQVSGGTDTLTFGQSVLLTGLTAGSNTFTMKYSVSGGTGNFNLRRINVIDMGS